MMTGLVEWLQSIGRGMRPWVTVKPWEQAVRVRLGKNARLLHPGVYVKLPFVDTATIYPIRTRTTYAPLQTLRSADGRTVTIGLIIRYRIGDLLRVLDTLHNPEGTLIHMAQGAVGDLVAETAAAAISPEKITDAVLARVHPEQYGVEDFAVLVSDNADLSQRTFRLLQESRWTDDTRAVDSMGRDG